MIRGTKLSYGSRKTTRAHIDEDDISAKSLRTMLFFPWVSTQDKDEHVAWNFPNQRPEHLEVYGLHSTLKGDQWRHITLKGWLIEAY
jgi:hypothetical protein